MSGVDSNRLFQRSTTAPLGTSVEAGGRSFEPVPRARSEDGFSERNRLTQPKQIAGAIDRRDIAAWNCVRRRLLRNANLGVWFERCSYGLSKLQNADVVV